MDAGSHYDYLRIKAEILPDRTRQVEYISKDGIQRPQKVIRNWRQVRELGSGSNGVVWMERAEDGALRAVKHIHKSQRVASYLQELVAMIKLSKDNIFFVQLHGWFESDRTVHIAMEYFPFGDLSTCFRNPLAEDLVKRIAQQLLEGLTRMHELGITHRDLKPQNIFVAQMDPIWVKIGDFGISKLVSNDGTALRTSHVGTQGFQAPEVLGLLDDASETSEYTHAVDIWSLGCVLYRLICRELPFPGGSLWRYCQGYGGFPESPLRSSRMTTGGIHILNELLAVDPSERPSGTRALQSPWFLQHEDSNEDMKRLREECQELTIDRIPNTPVSSERPQKIGSRATELHPDQKAAKSQAVVNPFSEHASTVRESKRMPDILNINSAFDVQSGQQDEQKDQSNPRMRQQDPVNLEQTIQNDLTRLPHGTAHANNPSYHWTPIKPQLVADGIWQDDFDISLWQDIDISLRQDFDISQFEAKGSEGSSRDENLVWNSNPSSDMGQQRVHREEAAAERSRRKKEESERRIRKINEAERWTSLEDEKAKRLRRLYEQAERSRRLEEEIEKWKRRKEARESAMADGAWKDEELSHVHVNFLMPKLSMELAATLDQETPGEQAVIILQRLLDELVVVLGRKLSDNEVKMVAEIWR